MTCLLILLTLFLIEQKFLILMKSSLSITSFVGRAYIVVSKKSSPYSRSSRFSPILYSRNFIFRFVIHFELACEACKICVQIHFFACGLAVALVPFVEKAIFAPLYYLCSFFKGPLTIFTRGLFLVSVFCFIDLFV